MKKKKIYTAIAVVLLIALYIMIFRFSAEDGERSSAISAKVAALLGKLYNALLGNQISGQVIIPLGVSPFEGIVRKIAHFTEYLCMGFLSYSIILMWYKPVFKGRMLILLQLFLSAGADELHQYFVPGRNASFKDVTLDVAGGITGMILIFGLKCIRGKISAYKKKGL